MNEQAREAVCASDFAKKLRSVMKTSQFRMACDTGIAQSSISIWLAAGWIPNGRQLALISRYTGASVDWLLGLSKKKEVSD